MEAIYKCSSKYTFEEHMRFEQYAFHASGRAKKVAKISLLLAGAAVLSMIVLSMLEKLTTATFFIPVLLVAFAVLVAAVNGNMGRKWAWKMNPSVQDAVQKYYFYADHFEYHFGENKVDIAYEAIYDIGETGTNIYIMLAPQQGMSIVKRSAPLNLLPFLQDKFKESRKA